MEKALDLGAFLIYGEVMTTMIAAYGLPSIYSENDHMVCCVSGV